MLLSNGDGTFGPPAIYFTGTTVIAVAVADVNGDGKLDVLVSGSCQAGDCSHTVINVLLGNGDGTFRQSQGSIATTAGAAFIRVADLNQDGKLDLVVGAGTIGVLLGNGDGSFQPEINYPYAAGAPVVVDVNGDGKLDIVDSNSPLGSTSNGSVSVQLGNGDGTFQPPLIYSSGGKNPGAVAVTDVNGDHRPDIIVPNQYAANGNFTPGSIGVLLGNGDGTFQPAVTLSPAENFPRFVTASDLNGDGTPDLIVINGCEATSNCSSSLAVLLGNGDGTFRSPVQYETGGPAGIALIEDVNGDGRPDVLMSILTPSSGASELPTSNAGLVSVLLGRGDGTLQAPVDYRSSGGINDDSIAVADLNGDGKLDFIVANQCFTVGNCAGWINVLLGNGDGTFRSGVSEPSGGGFAYSIAVGDINKDGIQDLIIANGSDGVDFSSNGAISVSLGNGDGTFRAVGNYDPGGFTPYSVAIGDLNRDGKPDMVVASFCATSTDCSTGIISVYLGNGDGTFRSPANYNSGGKNPVFVTIADLNADDKPDLVVSNYNQDSNNLGGTVAIFLGNGDGTFQPAVTYPSGGVGNSSVAVGDLNGDGKPDLVAANQCATTPCTFGPNGSIGVLLGQGDGTFQLTTVNTTPPINSLYFERITLADFNRDGKLDVASASGQFLMLGNGDGSFQSPLMLGASGFGIGVGDFNGDGKPDLAVGNSAVLLNVSPETRAVTSTTLASSPQPSSYNQSVSFTATVAHQGTGVPSGIVTFTDGAGTLGAVPLTNAVATLGTMVLTTGTHRVIASYSGDANFTPSTASALSQTVGKDATISTLTSSLNPSLVTQPFTLTASVTGQLGITPTGSIAFKFGSTTLATLALAGGKASLTTSFATPATRSINAVYSGDVNNLSSTSATLKQTVNKVSTATAVTSSLSPSNFGQSVTFTATVTSSNTSLGLPSPNGTVTFKDGVTSLGTGTVSGGVATLTTSMLAAGTHNISAVYGGNTDCSGSTSIKESQVVIGLPTATVVTSNVNSSAFGQSVTFTATVTSSSGSGVPTGYVTFRSGTTALGKVVMSSGTATLTITTLAVGTKSITAVYSGDTAFATSTSSVLSQVITRASTTTSLTSSLNPSSSNQSVTFTVTVSPPSYAGTPTGTVTFKSGSTVLTTVTLSGGTASFTTSSLPVGSDSITASYGGPSNFNTSSATLTQVVN